METNKYIYAPPHTAGLGSVVHGIVKATLFGIWLNRTVIRGYTPAGYGKCSLKSPECYHLPGSPFNVTHLSFYHYIIYHML